MITYIDGELHLSTHDVVILDFPTTCLTTLYLVGGLVLQFPCIVGICSNLRMFVMIWIDHLDGVPTSFGTYVEAFHHLYHDFIAREGPAPIPTCLLASCMWSEELLNGLTPHTRESNRLHTI
jgi:hypothetical protein